MIQGGLTALGYQIDSVIDHETKSKFFAIGFGATVGFGTRFVVNWLLNVSKAMFSFKDED